MAITDNSNYLLVIIGYPKIKINMKITICIPDTKCTSDVVDVVFYGLIFVILLLIII